MALLLALAPWGAAAPAAPPALTGWMPTGVSRGATAELTGLGTFSNWPVKVWVDRPGLTVAPQEKKGVFQVTAAGDAAAGVYYVRLFDDEGASELKPLLVSTGVTEVVEVEPNDEREASQKLDLPAVVSGKLAKGGDVDSFRFSLTAGQTLAVRVTANEVLDSPMDAIVQICDPEGFVLAQNDDERGLDPQVLFQAPRDGDYLARVFAFPTTPNSSIAFAGAETYVYRLEATAGPMLDYTLPLSLSKESSAEVQLVGQNLTDQQRAVTLPPADAAFETIYHPEVAGAVELPRVAMPSHVMPAATSLEAPWRLEQAPAVVSGRLESAGDEDVVVVTAAKGARLTIKVEARALGFPTDPQLRVLDSQGKVVAEADDTGRDDRDLTLAFAPPADGDYRLAVRDVYRHGGPRYAYRLTVAPETPAFTLAVAADLLRVKAGEEAELAVTVARVGGHKAPIQISLEGLPAGVTCEPATSEGAGETAKAVKLKVKAAADAAPSNGALRVVGAAPDQQVEAQCGTRPRLPLWLSVAK